MAGQQPMAFRMQEMLELLWKHGSVYVHRLDRKVLNRLIKKGSAKIVNGEYSGLRKTVSAAKPTSRPPIKMEPKTAGPYAKRRAAMEEAGLQYKGKTWGKIRVDLPREERERKINEKKVMWKKLKTFDKYNT